MAETPVIYLKPVAAKRYGVLSMLYLLTGILAWVAVFETPTAFVWQVFLWAVAGSTLLLANKVGKATAQGLQLRGDGLFTDDGDLLVRLQDIRKIDRGVFAFKPSNGFLLHLNSRAARGWAPGLWWRFGRVMGVGGVTSKVQGEIMAETIAARLKGDA